MLFDIVVVESQASGSCWPLWYCYCCLVSRCYFVLPFVIVLLLLVVVGVVEVVVVVVIVIVSVTVAVALDLAVCYCCLCGIAYATVAWYCLWCYCCVLLAVVC